MFTRIMTGHDDVIGVACECTLSESDLNRMHACFKSVCLRQASLARSSNSRGSKPSRFRLLLSQSRTAERPTSSYPPHRFRQNQF